MANDAFLVELKFFFVGFFMFCINKEKKKNSKRYRNCLEDQIYFSITIKLSDIKSKKLTVFTVHKVYTTKSFVIV
jgi:hypothetical protein